MAMNGIATSGHRRRRRHGIMSEINVTPMVDVMLVLLIIFMVSAPLLTVGVPIDPTRHDKHEIKSADCTDIVGQPSGRFSTLHDRHARRAFPQWLICCPSYINKLVLVDVRIAERSGRHNPVGAESPLHSHLYGRINTPRGMAREHLRKRVVR